MKRRVLLTQMILGESGKVVGFTGNLNQIGLLMAKGLKIGARINMDHMPNPGMPIIIQYGNSKLPVEEELAAKVIIEIDDLPPENFTLKNLD